MERYKRYMVFEYDGYYPGGGLSDCDVSFDTVKEAVDYEMLSDCDYREIFDREKGLRVEIIGG